MPSFETPTPIAATIEVASATSGSPPATASPRSSTCFPVTRPTGGRQGRTADPRRVRRRAAARQGAEAALMVEPRRRRVGRRVDRAAGGLAREGRRAGDRLSLRRSARRLPDHHRHRPDLARSRGCAEPQERHRRHQGRAGDRARRGQVGVGRRAPARARRQRGHQVLPTATRGSARPAATCGSRRPTAASRSTWRHATVVAKSANGDVRLGEVVRGSVVLESQLGDLEVGIREGTSAWLDVRAAAGKVHNALEAADPPRAVGRDRQGPGAHDRRQRRGPRP